MTRIKTVTLRKENGIATTDVDLGSVFSLLRNGTYKITIKRAGERRSVPQNDLMWLWFECIENETGTLKNDVYLYYCKKFLCKVVEMCGRQEIVVEKTSSLTKEQFTDFLNKVQADAATELGIQLPTPDDIHFEQFYQQII